MQVQFASILNSTYGLEGATLLDAKKLADAQKGTARLVKLVARTKAPVLEVRLASQFRFRGFQDNTVNRLLLMSSSEHHLHSVRMVTFIERW